MAFWENPTPIENIETNKDSSNSETQEYTPIKNKELEGENSDRKNDLEEAEALLAELDTQTESWENSKVNLEDLKDNISDYFTDNWSIIELPNWKKVISWWVNF